MQNPSFGYGTEMYRDVDWMLPSDRYILEFMASCEKPYHDEPVEWTPKVIGLNTTVTRKTAGARCRVLADRGLVKKLDRGVYQISELGTAFVEGELTVEEVQKL